jgi:hypothetical protein
MTLYKTTFNTYEVIFPCNVCLDDDSIAKAIGMESIVVGFRTRGKTTRICITYVIHVSELQANLLLVSELLLKGLRCLHLRLGYLNVRNIYALYSMVEGMKLGKTSCPNSTLNCETWR